MYCKHLHEELAREDVGEKAYNLSLMLRDGYPVPAGFVLTKQAFLNYGNNAELPEYLKQELQQFTKEVAAEKYMVRSSALGEDSAETSFAGQLQSFICGADEVSILENIKKCWQSYHAQHVQAYQQNSGFQLKGMGVVVQQLIEPDYAGVLFTESLLQDGAIMAEYVAGHAEKLVSGEVNPENFHCNKADGKTDKPVPFLTGALYETALKLEAKFGCAQDVEWAIKDNNFYIVQSRPVTAKANITAAKIYWSNTNVNENYPTAITPFLYSVARQAYYNYFKNLSKLLLVEEADVRRLEPDYANVIGIFGCHMYYNMSSIHNIICASPFAGLLKKSFDNFVGYQGASSTKNKAANFRQKIKFLYGFLKMNLLLKKHIITFENRADAYKNLVKNASGFEDFRNCYHAFLEIRMHSWYRASLADFFAMAYHGLLGKFCKKFYPHTHNAVLNNLIQAIPNLVSSKPIVETWHIAQLFNSNSAAKNLLETATEEVFWQQIQKDPQYFSIYTSIEKYLQNWGFRCSGELMLTESNYAEQPEKFISLLKQYCSRNNQNPAQIIAEKYKEREKIIREFHKRIWKKNAWFFPLAIVQSLLLQLLINLCSKGVAGRERVRLKQAQLYFNLKTVLNKIGQEFVRRKWLQNQTDILYLKHEEISENLTTSDMLPATLKSIVELRKKEWQANSKIVFPDDFSSVAGTYPIAESFAAQEQNNGALTGLTACGGVVKGRVKVLASILEAGKIDEGDILVTRQTDPGWACIFPLISGLIVERGGMLSHGAIVAREFGIPAIVGVEKATEKIPDGALVILDADNGKIILQ